MKNSTLTEINTPKQNTLSSLASSTCDGLKLKCISVRDGMPWLAAVFVEDDLITSAVLITERWLLADAQSLKHIK